MHETFLKDSAEETEETGHELILSLKRLDVWIDDWRLRLRMMSVCVEGCKDHHGGALVNLIHSYTEHVDPFVRKVTDELLEEVRFLRLTLEVQLCNLCRFLDPFSLCSTNGSSQASSTTLSQNSS